MEDGQSSIPPAPRRVAIPSAANQSHGQWKPLEVSYSRRERLIHVGPEALIQGVEAMVLWWALRNYVDTGSSQFSDRQLRTDPLLGLQNAGKGLSGKLMLLQQCLIDRCPRLRVHRIARGTFQLRVDGPVAVREH